MDINHPRYLDRLASVGTARTDLEVRVVDGDDQPLPGEIGEICVRGDVVMQVTGNPQASAESLKGGWLHTGDMGTFDEDGFLTLKDRSKDVIISGGTNIYPREVEKTWRRSLSLGGTPRIGARKSSPLSWPRVIKHQMKQHWIGYALIILRVSNALRRTSLSKSCQKTTMAKF